MFSGGNMETSTGEFTRLLKDCGAGNREALDKLLPLVYEELRRLAHSFLNRERSDHTLCLRFLKVPGAEVDGGRTWFSSSLLNSPTESLSTRSYKLLLVLPFSSAV